MFRIDKVMFVSGFLLLLLSVTGSLFSFFPESFDSFHLTITGSLITALGIVLRKKFN